MVEHVKNLGKAFGGVLAKMRSEKGFSQMRLASEAGLHLNAVSKLERGGQIPNLQTVFALAVALGVSGAELVAAVEKSMALQAGASRSRS